MRDIRKDLRERLASVIGRYADEITEYNRKLTDLEKSHHETLTALARERAALEQLLAIEDARAGIGAPTLAQKLATLVPLSDFLVAKVQAHGPIEKDDLRAEASLAGYLADGNGRAFHITLMNIAKCGRLLHLPDGRYGFPEHCATTLLGSDDRAVGGGIHRPPVEGPHRSVSTADHNEERQEFESPYAPVKGVRAWDQ
jgi:hypothetical protein